MQIDSSKIEFLVGDCEVLNNAYKTPALRTFSDRAVDFLSALSKELLSDKRSRANVDVMSYAYWIRRSSLMSAKKQHIDCDSRIGRGVAFHIAPSNVPVNFAVSMTSSFLAGNVSIIRVSNKQFVQVDIICDAMNKLLSSDFLDLRFYFCLIRYEHDDKITQELSNICDLRIIWGGNKTIENIRKAALPPRAIELAFADRHSIAIINSDEYLKENPEEIAKGFYTDTYYTDQNACSSPRIVVWTGNEVDKARKQFWDYLDRIVKRDYQMKPIQAVDKYSSLCTLGMVFPECKLVSDDNFIMRVEVDKLKSELMDYKHSGGYFFEYTAKSLDEIVPILGKQCQTVSVLGIDKEDVLNVVFENGVRGVDRVVPLGQTMGLEFIWDGFKMIQEMSRFIYKGVYL